MTKIRLYKRLVLLILVWFERCCLLKTEYVDNYPSGNPFKVIFIYIKRYRIACLIAFNLAICFELIEFSKFYLIELIIDEFSNKTIDEVKDYFSFSILFITVFGVVSPIIWALHSLIVEQSLSSSITFMVQRSLHRNLVMQHLAFFKNRSSGQLAMRVHQVASAVRTGIALTINQIPSGFVQFVGTAIMVATIHPLLAVPVIFWLAANIILVSWLIPRYAHSVEGIVAAVSSVSGQLCDIYNNILTVKIYGREVEKDPVVSSAFSELKNEHNNLCRYNTAMNIAIQMVNVWLLVLIVVIGLYSLSLDKISIGEFAAAIALAFRLASSVDWFIGVGQSITEVYGTLKKSQSLFLTPLTSIKSKPLIKIADLTFKDVCFYYQKEHPILEKINLTIYAGERVAIIGESGSGKSTLVNLIAGLNQTTNGTIYIDNKDISTIDGDSIRENIAVVSQDISLLNRSVKDNILYGIVNYQDFELNDILEQTCSSDFISKLQDDHGRKALMSFVGEKGANLSGGQKQRIVIARALLKKAKIIILDEATSALDQNLEKQILKNIMNTYRDATIISITHRISTLSDFERLFKLRNGRLEPYSIKLN